MNNDKNTGNLVYNADYEIEIFPDIFPSVFWVPASILGKTRYSNEEIKQMVCLEPDAKRKNINNLYEAIQLYQASMFKGIIDNVKFLDPDNCYLWDCHKSGYHAVRTNEGCCASDSNWLKYILDEKYDEIGFLTYQQNDGNGHIINYIKQDDWYYFIDMMMYRADSIKFTGKEDGSVNTYKNNEFMGFLHKAKTPDDFIKFFLYKNNNPPVMFCLAKCNDLIATGIQLEWTGKLKLSLKDEKMIFLFSKSENRKIVYCDDNYKECYKFVDAPKVLPDWSML